ncbi:alpha/beta fold hydrolase [Pseudenhygromyxa sp. WMMC2535]|uniref:alpha/beta fold hydrolase n=1 Tax=Pseudenhygromyxa sp. WMMC2535 TaxID=2712867 RepID=UPI001553DDD6|nr:alpha/beta fold hydrolase [Pseudenhygromyxa sp. WMMC2535]NVB36533.1 alpha/beta fold hydrolase [Pseudenhygromyxa sp. WMMC2535]
MIPARSAGHWWTIAPNLAGRVRPASVTDRPWSTTVAGPAGPLKLAGAIALPDPSLEGDAAEVLYLFVHGMGGSADSPYMREAAAAVQARGHASLRISMRGAGESGPDFYHAGLSADLTTLLADPSLERFRRVFVIGFSLGGHVALHLGWAADRDPRIAGIVTVCAPLDLTRNATALDRPRAWLYRRHVLSGLEEVYRKVHGASRRFDSIHHWDREVIVPRWGFADVRDYWESQTAGPRLVDIEVPVLFVAAEADPMIPADILRPYLRQGRAQRGELLDVAWSRRGGHVGFPPRIELGMAGPPGLMNQVLSWCEEQLVHFGS